MPFLGNCSYVLNFFNCIYMFLLLFLLVNFKYFILSKMLLISLLKVPFLWNSTKSMLVQNKNFTFLVNNEVFKKKIGSAVLTFDLPKIQCSYFSWFSMYVLISKFRWKMYHTNVLKICSCKKGVYLKYCKIAYSLLERKRLGVAI